MHACVQKPGVAVYKRTAKNLNCHQLLYNSHHRPPLLTSKMAVPGAAWPVALDMHVWVHQGLLCE